MSTQLVQIDVTGPVMPKAGEVLQGKATIETVQPKFGGEGADPKANPPEQRVVPGAPALGGTEYKGIALIGDVHGKMSELAELRAVLPEDYLHVQVGDLGAGFVPIIVPATEGRNFWFIRGNHDDPAECRKHPNYLGDWGRTALGPFAAFVLGGAYSIDQHQRRAWKQQTGKDYWWPDEELTAVELDEAVEAYKRMQPEVVVTHEAPATLIPSLIGDRPDKGSCIGSRTARALQRMFEAHQPKLWVFGHYHTSKTLTRKGTTFVCVSDAPEAYLLEEGQAWADGVRIKKSGDRWMKEAIPALDAGDSTVAAITVVDKRRDFSKVVPGDDGQATVEQPAPAVSQTQPTQETPVTAEVKAPKKAGVNPDRINPICPYCLVDPMCYHIDDARTPVLGGPVLVIRSILCQNCRKVITVMVLGVQGPEPVYPFKVPLPSKMSS